MLAVLEGRAGWDKCRLAAMLLLLFAALGSDATVAEDKRKGGPTPSPAGAEVYFVDLRDGATVATKFSVNFGLDRMGVAPAGSDRKDSGHHHLLIDTDLPPLDQPIPNDFNHLHFGAGQTEAQLTLRPGEHTLQLLLGDKDHIPHTPPVMSARIKIRVVAETPPAASAPPAPPPPPAPNARSLTPSPPGAEVYFVDLQDGATVQRKLRVHFGLRNMGIAPAGSDRENSGHHHLLIDAELPPLDQPIPNDFNHLHFGSGETETNLTLTPGEHTLQLLLGDGDHVPHNPPVMSKRIRVRVVDNTAATAPTPDPTPLAPTPTPDPTPPPTPTPPPVPPPAPNPTPTPDPTSTPTPNPPPARSPTRSAEGAEVYFTELKDGSTVPSKVTVAFGMRNMTLAPAGSSRSNSGHFHLLIDAALPPLDQPIPDDDSHLHFDKGETRVTLTLTPGRHTLQLLLGDKDHIPHKPPVMSPRITVRVVDRDTDRNNDRNAERKPSPRGARVYFIGRRNWDKIPTTVTLRFGVDNMDIRSAGETRRDSGHFHLLIDSKLPPMDKPIPNDSTHLDFSDGQTRARITLTPGEHTLQLLLGDDKHMPHDPPVMSAPLKVIVVGSRKRDYRDPDDPPRYRPRRDDPDYGPPRYGPPRYGPPGYGPPGYGRGGWRGGSDHYPD